MKTSHRSAPTHLHPIDRIRRRNQLNQSRGSRHRPGVQGLHNGHRKVGRQQGAGWGSAHQITRSHLHVFIDEFQFRTGCSHSHQQGMLTGARHPNADATSRGGEQTHQACRWRSTLNAANQSPWTDHRITLLDAIQPPLSKHDLLPPALRRSGDHSSRNRVVGPLTIQRKQPSQTGVIHLEQLQTRGIVLLLR